MINYYRYEIDLTQAEKLREDSTNDEVTATLLNDAGKTAKICTKKIRNSFQFLVVEEDTLILRQTEEQNYEKFTLKLFQNLPAKPKP